MPYSKIAVIAGLFVVCAAIWWHTVSYYRAHESEIVLATEQIVREIALPFRIAELYFEDPVEELPMPVFDVLVEDVADTWGQARSEGRTHEGVDIFAERGTPIFSATRGYVIRENFGTRGGTNLMVIGPGGIMYYYAHLDRISEGITRGVEVTVDTVLGYVGNTGNATGTPPHLHFGIYPARWDAINPYPLLTDRWE